MSGKGGPDRWPSSEITTHLGCEGEGKGKNGLPACASYLPHEIWIAAIVESGGVLNSKQPRARPHVFLITCHDLGRYLGCYGVQTLDTPHLDGLAAAGIRFSNAFSTASGCSPARTALATGRYPHSAGVMGLAHPPFGWGLAAGVRHVAEILGDAGYETHLFGLQHVSMRIERLGFEHVHPFEGKALSEGVSSQIADFLGSSLSGEPLYVEVNLEEVHRPYGEGSAFLNVQHDMDIPAYLPSDSSSRLEFSALHEDVQQADAGVGTILTSLEQAGLAEDALVIFTTDHGLAMPRAKCTLYDPGIEIALLMRWPQGGLPEALVVGGLVSNVDVLPTLLEILGVPMPGDVQGRSFLPLLRGESIAGRAAVYAEKTYHSYYDPMRAIRTERHKYIRNFETSFAVEVPGDVQLGSIFREHVELYQGSQHPPTELYDLHSDPLEQCNLAGGESHVEIERELDSELWTWMEQTDDPLLAGPVVSPSYREALEARTRAGSE
jgi:N-sulfoglucosamine sulfohydrolase